MKFKYENFSCDVDIFYNNVKDIMIRLYNKAKEQTEDQICDLVIVNSDFGYVCLKVKGDCGLISGYLDKTIFNSEEIVEELTDFLENLSPKCKGGYIPYHIELVQLKSYYEYNGEY